MRIDALSHWMNVRSLAKYYGDDDWLLLLSAVEILSFFGYEDETQSKAKSTTQSTRSQKEEPRAALRDARAYRDAATRVLKN
jgi:hypothetical protein